VTRGRPPVRLGDREVGPGLPPYVICEAGVTNYGDPELAHRQIDAAAAAGADAVKFQVWRTEELVSRHVAARLRDTLGYDWFERLKTKELPLDVLPALQTHAASLGITFTATPHDLPSLDVLDRDLDVPYLKVGSGEAHNLPFLAEVGRRGKPVVISFGFHADGEVVAAVDALRAAGAPAVVPLHCVTAYPTPHGDANLPRIAALATLTGLACGYSDHTVGRHALVAATALGACVLEKHLTFDKADPRSLDNPGALLPGEFADLVREVRETWQALQPPPAGAVEDWSRRARAWAGQSIVAARALAAGTVLEADMVRLKRPADGGLGPEHLTAILGRRLARAVPADEQVTPEHLGD
jgi:N,N'-diacetyllegionaminate synthase